ncbi:MAG: hypothetical protein A2Y76_07560 [Planctomycetes bacterium RBG_13_60_9]|nr:MAG: hypothetical protein A2Y76_07560 [Planctomycetes bacterium RBG_13_60_9]
MEKANTFLVIAIVAVVLFAIRVVFGWMRNAGMKARSRSRLSPWTIVIYDGCIADARIAYASLGLSFAGGMFWGIGYLAGMSAAFLCGAVLSAIGYVLAVYHLGDLLSWVLAGMAVIGERMRFLVSSVALVVSMMGAGANTAWYVTAL